MLKLRPRIRLVLLITFCSVCSCIALHFFIAHACNNHIFCTQFPCFNWLWHIIDCVSRQCNQVFCNVSSFSLWSSACSLWDCDTHCVNVTCTCIWRLFSLIWLRLFFKTVPFSAVKYVKKCDDMCVVPPEH